MLISESAKLLGHYYYCYYYYIIISFIYYHLRVQKKQTYLILKTAANKHPAVAYKQRHAKEDRSSASLFYVSIDGSS